MYKALAEAWYWDADVVSHLTPTQLMRYSGSSGDAADAKVTVGTWAQMQSYIDKYLHDNSPEVLLKKAERCYQRELLRQSYLRGEID